jgi:hypothetical protein
MLIELDAPGSRLREIACALKSGFDDLQETDSGWRWVQFRHPVWGRDAAGSTAERIPGQVFVGTDEPGDEADALVVAVGFVDSFTGEVHLGDGMVVGPEGRADPVRDEDIRSADPGMNRRLAAVALWDEGGVRALTGSVHGTREERFEVVSLGTAVDEAIREWLEELARTGTRTRQRKR